MGEAASVPTSSLIVLSIPLFFGLMLLEIVVSRWILRREVYRLGDSVANLSCGILEQLGVAFSKAALVFPYVFFYQWLANRGWMLRWPDGSGGWGIALWLVAFVGVDVAYYWWHRLSHEVYALWAAHVIHHQSEEYNLSVALRQGYLTDLTAIPFYLPIALLGVSPEIFVSAKAAMILYQFWIHTELVPKLGPLERVLNTPSHHRVHHGINPEYIDKNFGGTFIVWDRLFGTFAPEERPVVYGIVKPLRSYNVFRANLEVLGEIARIGHRRAWLQRPGWRPASQGGPLTPPDVSREKFTKFAPAGTSPALVASVFVATLGIAAGFFLGFEQLSARLAVGGAVLIVLGLAALSWLLRDGRDGMRDRA